MAKINSRSKGARGEKQAIEFLKGWTGLSFVRTPASGGLRWKMTDSTVGDIICDEPNYIFPLTIEVKNYKDINFQKLLYGARCEINDFWEQAIEDSKRGQKIPLLLMRYNGLPSNFFFAVIDYKTYLYLKKNQLLIGRRLIYNKEFVITNSNELSQIPYKLFYKTTSKLRKIRWNKKK